MTDRPLPKPGILQISPYVPGKAAVEGVAHPLKLSANENILGSSPAAREAFVSAIDELHLYPDGRCNALREAISARYGLEPENLLFGCGSDEIFQLIGQTFVQPGDNAVQGEHGFGAFAIATRAAGGEVRMAREIDLRIDVDEVLDCVDERTRIVWIANPANPTVAGELAADGKRVILVDADSYGASIAAVLGLLDESAGLAQACRLADQGLLDRQALEKIAAPVATKSGTFRVLTGITRADRWTELRASALALVLDRARDIADVVVVDAGFCLEADEEISFDTMAPRRNAATLRSLELADTVYAVGAADPVGVPRLVRGLAELEEAVPGVSPIVVLNRVRASAVGRGPERQLRDAWERYGPASALKGFLPHDAAAADAALLGGSLLLEAAPDSPLRHAIRELVCAPAQQKRKSSVFSSTARRRVKD